MGRLSIWVVPLFLILAPVLHAQIIVFVTPAGVTLSAGQQQQFTATVAGTSNTAVTWSLNPSTLGTISSSGLYTAPNSIPSRQQVEVIATSQADTTKFGDVVVTLLQSSVISVSVSPATAVLAEGQQQQFNATVTGSSNTAVTWSLNPSVGSISASGLFTAPASIPNSQSITVIATSQADTTKSGNATVTLSPPTLVSLACNPTGLRSGESTICTITLSGVAPTGGATVGISSNNSLLTVPTSVTVAAGSSIANFAATAGNISVAGSATITATFNNTTQSATIQLSAPITPAITIQTSPSGLQFSVDGGPQQTAPQTLSLSQGQHTIAVLTIQPGATGTQYLFTSWSDGGAASHTITVGTSAATYTATFKTQYRLTTSASPSAGGTVTPSSGGFYDANTVVQVNATPNSGYTFSGWTGSVASPSSTSTTVTMSAPQSVTGNFAPITSTPITIQTSPSGLLFTLDGGTPQAAPQIVSLSPGQHTIAVATTQTGGTGTQYLFTSWSDGLAASHTITVGSFAATYTATFKTQYQLTISASPVSGGTVTPASGAYYDAGTIVPVSATPNSGFIFSSWTGPVANAGVASTTVTMTSPQTVRANFTTAAPTCTFTLSASSATVGPTAPSGSVDVTTSPTCSFTASAAAGSFATVTNGPNYTGSSTVTYSIQPNSGGTRSTTLTIANQTFTINQLTGCVLGLSPTSASFPAALSGGSQTAAFSVGSTSSTCGFTATSSNTSFLTVASSNGSPTVFYTIFSNSSTAGRTATITVTGQGGAAGQTQVFTVIQGGATPCTFALAQSGQAFLAAGGTGTASVLAPAGCAWSTTNNSSFVSISGGGSGNGTVSYTVQSNPNTTSRVGSLTIAGLPYAVTQAGA